jgi:hypothetical protein
LTRRKMLLMVICLTGANLKIGTYPDISLQIAGFLGRGCLYLYMKVEWRVMPAMVRSEEVARMRGAGI